MASSRLSKRQSNKLFFPVECANRESPGTFWVCEKSSTPFHDLLETRLRASVDSLPKEDRFCKHQFVAAKRNGKWFRGQVKQMGFGARSERLHVFLLDVGMVESIEKSYIRSLSPEFLEEPFRARKFCLYPLVPSGSEVDLETLKLKPMPCEEWTPSAQTMVSALFQEACHLFMTIEGVDEEQTWYGRLHLSKTPELDPENLTCLNELLLVKGVAMEDCQRFTVSDFVPNSRLWQTLPLMPQQSGRVNSSAAQKTLSPPVLPTVSFAAYVEEYGKQKKAEEVKLISMEVPEPSARETWNTDEEASLQPRGRGERIVAHNLPIIGRINSRESVAKSPDPSEQRFASLKPSETPPPSKSLPSKVVFRAAGIDVGNCPVGRSATPSASPVNPKANSKNYAHEAAQMIKSPPKSPGSPSARTQMLLSTLKALKTGVQAPINTPKPVVSQLSTPPTHVASPALVHTLPVTSPPSKKEAMVTLISPVIEEKTTAPPPVANTRLASLLKKARKENATPTDVPAPNEISATNAVVEGIQPLPVVQKAPVPTQAAKILEIREDDVKNEEICLTSGENPTMEEKIQTPPPAVNTRLANLLKMARKVNATPIAPIPNEISAEIEANGAQKGLNPDKPEASEAKIVEIKEAEVKKEEIYRGSDVSTRERIAGESIAATRHLECFGTFLPELERHRRVLVTGVNPVRPYTELGATPLSNLVHCIIANEPWNLTALSQLQSHTWGSLLRGRNVAIIAPPGAKKTWSYLIPIVNNLLNPEDYTEVPSGCGPLLLILSATWEKAQSVYDNVTELTRGQRDFTVKILHGGKLEQARITAMCNGCTILVATLPAFLRVLKQGPLVTNLFRCCHWVIEELDALCQYNKTEMEIVLKEYTKAIKEFKLPMRQIIAVGQEWTQSVAGFVKNCMEMPLIYIGSYIEAAVFGGMTSRAVIVREDNKEEHLMEIVGEAIDHKKVIIFCGNAEEVNFVAGLVEMLRDELQPMKAHGHVTRMDLHDVSTRWNNLAPKQPAVLVVTDDVLSTLDIRNADLLIHYDIPLESKTGFGFRLTTAMDHYQESSKSTVPQSVVFVTEQVGAQLPTIIRFLRRTNGQVDPFLKALLREYLNQTEEDKEGAKFCSNMRQWGACRAKLCPDRHHIVKAMDTPTLPTCGEVIVLVSHVVSATQYYARILQHTNLEGKTQKYSAYFALASKLSLYFANHPLEYVGSQVQVGQVCAIRNVTSHTGAVSYERVRITRVIRDHRIPSSLPLEVQVQYIDHGKIQIEELDKLVLMGPELVNEAPLVAEILVPNVKPVDQDQTWNYEATDYVQRKILKKELRGKIKLSLGNTLWLDPLVVQHRLDDHTVINEWNVSRELVKEGWAEPSPVHLEKLYAFCTTAEITLPDYTQSVSRGVACVGRTAFLPEPDMEEVFVSSMVNPTHFYVQRTKFNICLDDLQDEIASHVAKTITSDLKSSKLRSGLVCLARFPEDDSWYRARILENRLESIGKVRVFYSDFGDSAEVGLEDMRVIPDYLVLKLPYQAIKCCLTGIVPLDTDWIPEAIDILTELTQDDLILQPMMAQVIKKEETETDMLYGVILYNEEGMNVASFLIQEELVQMSGEAHQHPEWFKDLQVIQSREEDGVGEEEAEEEEAEYPQGMDVFGELEFMGDPAEFLRALGVNLPPGLEEMSKQKMKEFEQERNARADQEQIREARRVRESQESQESALVSPQSAQPVNSKPKAKLSKGLLAAMGGWKGGKSDKVKKKTKIRTPAVQWADLNNCVQLTILLRGLKENFTVSMTSESLHFKAVVDGIEYSLDETLYAAIDADQCVSKLQGYGLTLRLTKVVAESWPRLLKTEQKVAWLKVDFEAALALEEDLHETDNYEAYQAKLDEIREKGGARKTQGKVLHVDPEDYSSDSGDEDSDEDQVLDKGDLVFPGPYSVL